MFLYVIVKTVIACSIGALMLRIVHGYLTIQRLNGCNRNITNIDGIVLVYSRVCVFVLVSALFASQTYQRHMSSARKRFLVTASTSEFFHQLNNYPEQ
jgi:hypothetical protein